MQILRKRRLPSKLLRSRWRRRSPGRHFPFHDSPSKSERCFHPRWHWRAIYRRAIFWRCSIAWFELNRTCVGVQRQPVTTEPIWLRRARRNPNARTGIFSAAQQLRIRFCARAQFRAARVPLTSVLRSHLRYEQRCPEDSGSVAVLHFWSAAEEEIAR